MIGISLLTLVPGVFGGSATCARELTRELARSGTLGYRVFVPTLAQGLRGRKTKLACTPS